MAYQYLTKFFSSNNNQKCGIGTGSYLDQISVSLISHKNKKKLDIFVVKDTICLHFLEKDSIAIFFRKSRFEFSLITIRNRF